MLTATAVVIVEVANALKWAVCGNHDERHEDRRRWGESPHFHFRADVCWVCFSNQLPEWHLKTNTSLLDLSCFITTVISTSLYQQTNINKGEKNVPFYIYCTWWRRIFTLRTQLLLLDRSVIILIRYQESALKLLCFSFRKGLNSSFRNFISEFCASVLLSHCLYHLTYNNSIVNTKSQRSVKLVMGDIATLPFET